MKKRVLVGAVVSLGLCGLIVAAARPEWFGFGAASSVRARARGYWDARLKGDVQSVAPFVHPLQKAVTDNSVLITEAYEITGVKVEGDEALVGIKAKYRFKSPLMAKMSRDITHQDKWVRYRGQWYHAQHPVGLGEVLEQGLGKWKPAVDTTTPPAPQAPASQPAGK